MASDLLLEAAREERPPQRSAPDHRPPGRPPHRHALRVALVSASGRISFGLCADPDAIDGLDLIAEGIEREIHALGGAVAGTSTPLASLSRRPHDEQ
jgi:hypothetical protein